MLMCFEFKSHYSTSPIIDNFLGFLDYLYRYRGDLLSYFNVGSIKAAPGEKVFGSLKVGLMADGSPIEIPVILINGYSSGPVLYVQAACHGEEINGVEVIRRVVNSLNPKKLRGSLIAVPVANPLAFRSKQSYTPIEFENMNRVFPGRPDGRLSERMAYAIWSNCIKDKADYVIDLHTGVRTMLTFIFVEYGEDEVIRKSSELARIFGTEYIVKEVRDEYWKRIRFGGKLRNVCNEHGIPSITPELDGRRSLNEEAIKIGVRGVLNVMKFLGMIDGNIELPPKQYILKWSPGEPKITSSSGGIFISKVKPGQMVEEGQVLGFIYSVKTLDVVEEIKASKRGIVRYVTEYPVINAGDRILEISEVIEVIENEN